MPIINIDKIADDIVEQYYHTLEYCDHSDVGVLIDRILYVAFGQELQNDVWQSMQVDYDNGITISECVDKVFEDFDAEDLYK